MDVALEHGVKHDTERMRIICPSCSATYDVPDSLVTPGRIVRCARCGREWSPVQAAPEPPPASPEPPPVQEAVSRPPEPPPPAESQAQLRQSAMDRLSAHPAARPSGNGLRIAWAVSLVVLIALAGAAYVLRTQVVSAWPPSARAYALFGMQTANHGNRP